MPTVDLTVTISVILGVSAIISPIITCIIDNRYRIKLKKIELKQHKYETTIIHQRQIFENYLKYIGRGNLENDSELSQYGECYLLAYMYAPDSLKPDMEQAHRLVIYKKLEDADALLEKISKELGDIVSRM